MLPTRLHGDPKEIQRDLVQIMSRMWNEVEIFPFLTHREMQQRVASHYL